MAAVSAADRRCSLACSTGRKGQLIPPTLKRLLIKLTVSDVTAHLVLGDHQVLGYGLLLFLVGHFGSEVSVGPERSGSCSKTCLGSAPARGGARCYSASLRLHRLLPLVAGRVRAGAPQPAKTRLFTASPTLI